MEIKLPTDSQKHAAAIELGATLLAKGKHPDLVKLRLRRLALPVEAVESLWPTMEDRARTIVQANHRRNIAFGLTWLALGLALLITNLYLVLCGAGSRSTSIME